MGAVEPQVRARAHLYRAPVDHIVARDLRRYYAVLLDELVQLRFETSELLVLLDACRHRTAEPWSYRWMWSYVQGYVLEEPARHVGPAARSRSDLMALVEKVRGLSPGTTMALCDAIERFWLGPWEAEPASAAAVDPGQLRERLRVVGLLR